MSVENILILKFFVMNYNFLRFKKIMFSFFKVGNYF